CWARMRPTYRCSRSESSATKMRGSSCTGDGTGAIGPAMGEDLATGRLRPGDNRKFVVRILTDSPHDGTHRNVLYLDLPSRTECGRAPRRFPACSDSSPPCAPWC